MTALAFCGPFICVAEGPFLQLLHQESSELVTSYQVFHKQAIHGILVCSRSESSLTLFIYGGCYIRSISLIFLEQAGEAQDSVHRNQVPLVYLSRILRCPDWILDASIASSNGSADTVERRTVAAITAHNALLQIEVQYDPEQKHGTPSRYFIPVLSEGH